MINQMPSTSKEDAFTSTRSAFPPEAYQTENTLNLSIPASDAVTHKRKTSWIQLAGHPGVFAAAGPKTIWKKQLSCDEHEAHVYRSLMHDSLSQFIPRLYREVEYNGSAFIEIEDLLQHFSEPNMMDIKMGTRTFLESEVTNLKLRSDLYEKMLKIDRSALTDEEHQCQAVTKLRYMQFREASTSSAKLGFRIDAVRMAGQPTDNNFKDVATKQQVIAAIDKYIAGEELICQKILCRLMELRQCFARSAYFRQHELIGSSLLVMYDNDNHANVWMIDFAKSLPVTDRVLTHRDVWQPGNHEEGYLTGLDNLITVTEELLQRIQHERSTAKLPLTTC